MTAESSTTDFTDGTDGRKVLTGEQEVRIVALLLALEFNRELSFDDLRHIRMCLAELPPEIVAIAAGQRIKFS